LSTTTEGIANLKRTAAAAGRTVTVAYVLRSHPALAAMRDAIEEGRFGRTLEVVAVAGQHFPKYRPTYRETYYAHRATGGGAIQDALTHLLDAAQWIAGPVTRLCADADHLVLDGVEVEDTVHMLTRHGSVLGCFSLNQHQTANESTLTVIGQRGTARFEYHRARWGWLVEPDGQWQYEEADDNDRDGFFVRQANRFLDSIEGRAEPLCSLDDGYRALQVSLAAIESCRTNSWIHVAATELAKDHHA
jgi:predicted dehydrogenase